MSLRAHNFLPRYKSESHDFVSDFFVPALNDAIRYDRAVGYFSSTALVSISRGLYSLVQNGGSIRIIASPELSQSDYEAIEQGYKSRGEVAGEALLRSLKAAQSDEDIDRLNLVANLIAAKRCEIKIAIQRSRPGIYHEKIGIIEDLEGNMIAFTGSLNETANAFESNYESISVFCDWQVKEYVDTYASDFEDLWNDRSKKVEVKKFDLIDKAIIDKYLRADRKLVSHDKITAVPNIKEVTMPYGPVMPQWLNLHSYQKLAVEAFEKHDGQGIFDMATGTGKTLTALAAMTTISHKINNALGVIIVVPYVHLIEQWIQDIKAFGITDTIACSASNKTWPEELHSAVRFLQFKDKFFCCITTVATFCSSKIQDLLQRYIEKPLMLIADEAHNLGANKAQETLRNSHFRYKLALSATLSRHHDEDGTAFLESYFGKKCIEYDLKQAIDEGFLTPYEYHPIFVSMSAEERDNYADLTAKIGKALNATNQSEKKISEAAEKLMIQRSRLIANVSSKIDALAKTIEPFKAESNILIYCGSAGKPSYENDFYYDDKSEIDQIEEVVKLVSEYNMSVLEFTSKKSAKNREVAKEFFSNEQIQVLVAIKCLDEGVNITGIKKAFILASSTNPKEYIQRRGRVLRRSPGKERAYIYDFIVLPYPLNACLNMSNDEKKLYRRLVQNEMGRFKEFASLCMNKTLNLADLTNICSFFKIDSSIPLEKETCYGQ